MTDKTRQNIGALCLAVACLIVGLIARPESELLGALCFTAAAFLGLVSLVNLGLDLMKPKQD